MAVHPYSFGIDHLSRHEGYLRAVQFLWLSFGVLIVAFPISGCVDASTTDDAITDDDDDVFDANDGASDTVSGPDDDDAFDDDYADDDRFDDDSDDDSDDDTDDSIFPFTCTPISDPQPSLGICSSYMQRSGSPFPGEHCAIAARSGSDLGAEIQQAPDGTLYALVNSGGELRLYEIESETKSAAPGAFEPRKFEILASNVVVARFAISDNGLFHVVYSGAARELKYAVGCFGGQWDTFEISKNGPVYQYNLAIAVGRDGIPHIAWQSSSGFDLRYATPTPPDFDSWPVEVLRDFQGWSPFFAAFAGVHIDIAINAGGDVHIASLSDFGFWVNLEHLSKSDANWTNETIDFGAISHPKMLLGDKQGEIALVYVSGWGASDARSWIAVFQNGTWRRFGIDRFFYDRDLDNIGTAEWGSATAAIAYLDEQSGAQLGSRLWKTEFGPSGKAKTLVREWPVGTDPNFLFYAGDLSGDWAVSYFEWIEGPMLLRSTGSGTSVNSLTDQPFYQTIDFAFGPSGEIMLAAVAGDDTIRYIGNPNDEWIGQIVGYADSTQLDRISIAADQGGNAHIVYRDGEHLVYSTNSSGDWQGESINSSLEHPVASQGFVAVDSHDEIYVAFSDDAAGAWHMAHRQAGNWSYEPIPHVGTGLVADFVFGPDDVAYIAYKRYDDANLGSYLIAKTGSRWPPLFRYPKAFGRAHLATDEHGHIHLVFNAVTASGFGEHMFYASNRTGAFTLQSFDNATESFVAWDSNRSVAVIYRECLDRLEIDDALNVVADSAPCPFRSTYFRDEINGVAVDSTGTQHVIVGGPAGEAPGIGYVRVYPPTAP
ncbi:hypothetical protein K8I61_12670 [bacterium]|nr:hypothetical protein [bacterium]